MSAPTAAAPRATRGAMVLAVRLIALAAWVLVVGVAVLPVVRQVDRLPGPLQLAVGLLAGHLLVVLAGLVRLRPVAEGRGPRRHVASLVLAGLLLLVSLLLGSPFYQAVVPGLLWAPGYWSVPWFLWAVALLPPRRHLPLLVGLAAVLVALYLDAMRRTDTLHRLFDLAPLVWMVEPLAVVTVFVGAVLTAGRRRQAQHEAQLAAEQLRGETQGRALLEREATRLLQDHVLHALHALAQPGGGVARELVVDECRQAVRVLDDAGSNDRLVDLSWQLAHDAQLGTRRVVVHGQAPPAPTRVARRIQVALRTLAERTSSRGLDVTLAGCGERWRVEVRGARPDPDDLAQLSGLLEVVGGRLVVTGDGTPDPAVELHWPVDPQAAPRAWGAAVDVATRRAMPVAGWPGMVASSVMTVLCASLSLQPAVAALNALVVLGVGAATSRRLRFHDMRRRDLLLVCGTVLVGWLVALAVAPVPLPFLGAVWMVWGCGAVLLVVALQLSTSRALLLTAGWATVLTLTTLGRFGWPGSGPVLAPLVGAGSGELLVGILALAVVRRLTAEDEARVHHVETIRRATAELHLGAALDQQWSHTVTGAVLPMLRRVADGEQDPLDPALVATARQWVVSVREELVLGPGQPGLISALALLRSQGWTIGSSLGEAGERREAGHLAELLQCVGPPARPGQQLTLSSDERLATAVVLEPSAGQLAAWPEALARVRGSVVGDEDFARLQVSRSGEPTAPALA